MARIRTRAYEVPGAAAERGVFRRQRVREIFGTVVAPVGVSLAEVA